MTDYLETHPKVVLAFFATLLVFTAHYVISLIQYNKLARSKSPHKTPPLVPHVLPFLGILPLQYFLSPLDFFKSSYYGLLQHPVRIKLFTKELYVIQGQENVVAHLAETSSSNTVFNAQFLRKVCGMSDGAVERFGSENEKVPKYFEAKYLTAAPIYAWSSNVIRRYLAGRSAFQLSKRFETNLKARIEAHPALATPEGIVLEDFVDFFCNTVIAAFIDGLCGKGLLERNPWFTGPFWTLCDNLPIYMNGTPRFIAPKVFKARDDVLEAVVDWQAWANENFDEHTTPLDEDGDDPFWGSKFFRERFNTFVHDMGFDPRDVAAMELGFLFGSNSNVTLNTYQCAIDVFKDKALLEDIRKEVKACRTDGNSSLQFDIAKLIQQPLLQAVFSETLRLRCHNMYIRKTMDTINNMGWVIPKGNYAIAWSTPGQMDPKLWASGPNSTHPVDTFWPGRFLKYTDKSEIPQFVPSATEGGWLPFGSGANLCPGNHFAKIHCILTVAMMVESFECDILAKPKNLEPDLSKFGMGILGPKGKVASRLRPREVKA